MGTQRVGENIYENSLYNKMDDLNKILETKKKNI